MPWPAGAELGELAKLINYGPWVPPAEFSFNEQYEGLDTPEAVEQRRREGIRAKGGGLIGPLFKALVDRGVEVRTSIPATRLVTDDTLAVTGVVAGPAGNEKRIGARRGVVLACGGFEWNKEMVKTYIGYDVQPMTPWMNTGDGHLMAMEVGAKMGNMTSFFSYGVIYEPFEKGRDGNPLPQMMMGLGAGSIIVNQHGRRFMHGGYTYNDFSHPFGFFDQRNPGYTNKPPAWVIFGAEHLEKGVIPPPRCSAAPIRAGRLHRAERDHGLPCRPPSRGHVGTRHRIGQRHARCDREVSGSADRRRRTGGALRGRIGNDRLRASALLHCRLAFDAASSPANIAAPSGPSSMTSMKCPSVATVSRYPKRTSPLRPNCFHVMPLAATTSDAASKSSIRKPR
jgi:hypothetical protein